MNKKFTALVSSLIIINISAAYAGDVNGRYAIRGAGLLSCKTFIEERSKQSPAYMMIGGWMDGYITAYNQLQDNTFDVTSYETTELLSVVINRHCVNNLNDILAPVLNSLLTRLHANRIKTASPYITINVGKYNGSLYVQTIKEIQRRLTQKGLYKKTANGLWNDETQTAISNYQKQHGFDVTGYPDQKTIWHLFRSEN